MEMKVKRILIVLFIMVSLKGESLFLHWRSLWFASANEKLFTSARFGSGFGVEFLSSRGRIACFISWGRSEFKTGKGDFYSSDSLQADMIGFGMSYFLLNPEEYLFCPFVAVGGNLTYWRWKEVFEERYSSKEERISKVFYRGKLSFYPLLSSGFSVCFSRKFAIQLRALFIPDKVSGRNRELYQTGFSLAGIDFGLEVKL